MATSENKFRVLRNCFEAAMDFETALGCVGWADKPADQVAVLRRQWDKWERSFELGE